MSWAYYNEIDPFAAEWLRRLIASGLIAPGEVDTRSIEDVRPDDLRGFTQCHFFAGIGVWSHALIGAGWPDDRPVWTGSCPCQPFSAAGKGAGFADERHLWPAWLHLIREQTPRVVFGEQVASKDGLAWIDVVQADLEAAGYTSAALDLCAAGVGAPHIRQRLYFVGHAHHHGGGRDGRGLPRTESSLGRGVRCLIDGLESTGTACELADTDGRHTSAEGLQRSRQHGQQQENGCAVPLADASEPGRSAQQERPAGEDGRAPPESRRLRDSFWSACDWLPCIDGKARPVEPGTFPLAHGAPARVGRLRAYGNAIVAPQAQAFVEAYMECRP